MINFYKKTRKLTDDDFKQLITLISNKDKFAVTDLYESYKNFMYAAIKKYRLEEDEKDYCIDVGFTRMILKEPLHKLDRETFQKYLWIYCKRSALRFIRDTFETKKGRFAQNCVCSYEDFGDENETSSDKWINNVESLYDLEFSVIRKQQIEEITRVVDTYGHKKAVECFKLSCLYGLNNDEIAKRTNVKYGSVCAFISNVRKYLKNRGLTYVDSISDY